MEKDKKYSRQIILPEIGTEGQRKIRNSRVLVIGAGGLGCPVLLYLASSGIGTLGIIDGDIVEDTNLQRQVLFDPRDSGKKKAFVAAERIKIQNPDCNVIPYPEFLTPENAEKIISQFDLVIDGSDNFPTRYLVNDACLVTSKPFVSGSILRFEGQVSVYNYQDGPTYRCLFPEIPFPGEVPSCADAGIVGPVAGITGSMMALETIKLLTGAGNVLSGKLWIYDGLNGTFRLLKFSKAKPFEKPSLQKEYAFSCDDPNELAYNDFISSARSGILVDVREEWENGENNIGGICIPLSLLTARIKELKGKDIFFYCDSGKRSAMAVKIAEQNKIKAYQLRGGLLQVRVTS